MNTLELRFAAALALSCLGTLSTSLAHAEEQPIGVATGARADAPENDARARHASDHSERAITQAALPLTISPVASQNHALTSAFGGYDAAAGKPRGDVAAEVRLFGPVSLRAGGSYAPSRDQVRPTAGLKLGLASRQRHGFDAAALVQYRPEGLTEPEGEIEVGLTGAAYSGATAVIANVIYGQDPEANELDGELRLALLTRVASRGHLGLDSRVRVGKPRAAEREPIFDLLVGPTGSVRLGPVAISAQSGLSALKLRAQPSATGIFALVGLATEF